MTAIFDEEMISTKDQHEHVGKLGLARNDTSSVQYTDFDTEVRDQVLEVAMEVFRQHCAKHLEIIPVRLQGDFPQLNKYFHMWIFLYSSLNITDTQNF